ncbi:hypothetical protein T190115A13A_40236 [Tenacibaculum sp. 190524A02b]|uniref:Uncharacterized protein n=1 Tax=Tenacibaculum vairaonense TaxID=3137860 RepID=A0ABP1FHL2_9FLAO
MTTLLHILITLFFKSAQKRLKNKTNNILKYNKLRIVRFLSGDYLYMIHNNLVVLNKIFKNHKKLLAQTI